MLVFWGYNLIGKKRLGVKISEDLELVKSYQVFFFMIPLFFQKRIVGYDFYRKKYYELDDKLENKLLKLEKNATPKQLSKTIKQYGKEARDRLKYYETHKEEIEREDSKNFIKFLKNVGILIIVILLIIIIKSIFF